MIRLEDSGIALKTYKEAKDEIGIYECNKKRIDDDTTIVYERFYESTVETGSFAKDHEIITLWLCTVSVFCKCGTYHRIPCDIPAKYQILGRLHDLKNKYDISFEYPKKQPEGSLIVPILNTKMVSKRVEDIDYWL